MINREIVGYLSKISSEFSVISVMGARHCGKTTLVKSEIKSGMEMTPSFARNIVTYCEVLGADLLTSSIIYHLFGTFEPPCRSCLYQLWRHLRDSKSWRTDYGDSAGQAETF